MKPPTRRVLWLGEATSPSEVVIAAGLRDHLALRGWFVHGPHHPPFPPLDTAAFTLVHCWGMEGVAAWLPALLALRDAGRPAILTPLATETTTATSDAFPFPDTPPPPAAGVRGATLRLGRLRQAFALTQVAHLLPMTREEMTVFHRVFPAGDRLPVTFLPPEGDPDAAIGAVAATVAAVYDAVAVAVIHPPAAMGRASDAYVATLEAELGREYAARATPDRDTEALEAEVAWYRDLVEGGEVWREWRRAEAEAAERLAHIMRLNAALTVVREEISRDHAVVAYTEGQRDLSVAALIEAREERDQSVARGRAQVVVVERERDAIVRERDAVERERVHATRGLIALEAANAALRDARAALEAEIRWRSEAMDALVAERDWLRSRIPPAPPTLRERVGRAVRTRRPPNAGTNGTHPKGTRECAS